jgi:hypothetical protein
MGQPFRATDRAGDRRHRLCAGCACHLRLVPARMSAEPRLERGRRPHRSAGDTLRGPGASIPLSAATWQALRLAMTNTARTGRAWENSSKISLGRTRPSARSRRASPSVQSWRRSCEYPAPRADLFVLCHRRLCHPDTWRRRTAIGILPVPPSAGCVSRRCLRFGRCIALPRARPRALPRGSWCRRQDNGSRMSLPSAAFARASPCRGSLRKRPIARGRLGGVAGVHPQAPFQPSNAFLELLDERLQGLQLAHPSLQGDQRRPYSRRERLARSFQCVHDAHGDPMPRIDQALRSQD